MKICDFCKKERMFPHICNPKKPHDCKVDGHVGKSGLITMFVCKHCGFSEELAPELQPSEAELCVGQGIDYLHHYEGDD